MKNSRVPELHLFILWEKARHQEAKILADIRKKFEVVSITEVQWSKQRFAQNLTRFYGTLLPKNSFKEEHCGNGPFLAVVVRDNTPRYDTYQTSRGPEHVNSTMFEAKTRYREWTGGGHKVHATNSPAEFAHDSMLLFEKTPESYSAKGGNTNNQAGESTVADQYKKDIVGCDGWESLTQLFTVLNSTIPYVVLRNFDPLPDNFYMDQHGDIDLLVADFDNAAYIMNAKKVFTEEYRVHMVVPIGGKDILFDLRYIGDEYFDKAWQQQVIDGRTLYKQTIYIPSEPDHVFSVMYHALIHKNSVHDSYRKTAIRILRDIGKIRLPLMSNRRMTALVGAYMKSHNFTVTRPIDRSVLYNPNHAEKLTRLLR